MEYLPLWPSPQKFKFDKKINKFPDSKLEYIENFFSKEYKSKYCVLTSSARVGILLILKFKKFNRSKIIKIPKWSSHCLYDAIGSLTNISCIDDKKNNCELIVHQLGNTFNYQRKTSLIIDDSADSLPTEDFVPFLNSKFSEVISLPKIIGSYSGGIILTNNKKLFLDLKSKQKLALEFSKKQSLRKYECLLMKKNNFDWHYHESFNISVDENTVINVYDNLKNFYLNKKIITKRRERYFNKQFKTFDKYRIGPCGFLKFNKKYNKIFESRQINTSRNSFTEKYKKMNLIPLHFTIKESVLEKKINRILKN